AAGLGDPRASELLVDGLLLRDACGPAPVMATVREPARPRSQRRSGVLEARLALLEERRDAFPEVARADRQHLIAVLHRDRLLEAAGVDRVLETLLGEAQGERRVAQHAAGQLARRLVERV